ncbi:endonuclease domain-containing protein [Herbiconiux sp. YIM B11900]|uniref:endonuclease domain-containing protein n=1 Tax=Herbiconiux sp. YIM B11900 TaxID=3404131 RepID=UPI003F84749F
MQRLLPEVASVPVLRRLGFTERAVLDLCRNESLIRVRRGYYARPDARIDVVRAVRLGGRLTSYSALRELGAWCPPDDERLHVAVDAHARALRDPDTGAPFRERPDVAVHWKTGVVGSLRSDPIVPIARAIRHLPSDLDPAFTVAVLDSVLRGQLATRRQLMAEFSTVPRLGQALQRTDARAESGTESIARVRLREAGIDARLQVRMPPYRVDLLIAGRLIVEVDGKEFHDSESTFESDRRRAAELTRRGYRVLHFSYSQVIYEWPRCLAAILAALADL